MSHRTSVLLCVSAAFALAAGGSIAQPGGHGGPPKGHAAPRPAAAEPHPGPSGYQRVTPPQGWNTRPAAINRPTLQHNYQAARSFAIGAYHPPTANWSARRWTFGQILPRIFSSPQYLIGDYWLFALEVPPVGCEWVRYGNDALLINVATGEILQVEYGVFA